MRDIMLRYPMIEDPTPFLAGSGSAQFPKATDHPKAVGALAAVVAENITNLVVENLTIQWPLSNNVPISWQHPERIENGSPRIHKLDYSTAKQTEFSGFWGNNLLGGYIHAPILKSSSNKKAVYEITNSTIKIIK